MKSIIKIFGLIVFAVSIGLVSCEIDPPPTNPYPDALASPNPELDFKNINIPNPTFSMEKGKIVRMDIAGILNPVTKEWIELIGTNAENSLKAGSLGEKAKGNIFVEVDGEPKFILIWLPEPDENKLIDYVFLVDNSGSMSQEANAVAEQILKYAEYLVEKNFDIRFGCVGYGGNVNLEYNYLVNGYGVTGALNLTSYTYIDAFLNRSGNSGTSRTKGYMGEDADELKSIAQSSYSKSGGECSVQAIRFADENFTTRFRPGAQRIYLNFTDDANYPGGNPEISIDYIKNPENWNTSKGTIHSVISSDSIIITRYPYGEKSWLLSEYTGGTTLFTDPNFTTIISGGAKVSSQMRTKAEASEYISLIDLPVTGAILYSSIIRFKNTSKVPDGKHKVKITVQSTDRTVQGEKLFENVTFDSGNNPKKPKK